MILSALVSEVQQQTSLPWELIVQRAREAWPNSVDFKEVQVRLLVDALIREYAKIRVPDRTHTFERQLSIQ
jgi:hypothetical protein